MAIKSVPDKNTPQEDGKYDFSNLTFEELFKVPVVEMSFHGEPLGGVDFFELDFLSLQRIPFIENTGEKEIVGDSGDADDVNDDSFDFLSLSFEELLKVPVKEDNLAETDFDSLSLAELMKLPVRRAFTPDQEPDALDKLISKNTFSDLISDGSGSSNSGNPLLYISYGNLGGVSDTSPPIDNGGNNGNSNPGGGFGTPTLNYVPTISIAPSAPADPLGVNESTIGMTTSANFADNFTTNANYGLDGAGFLTGPSYALSIIAGPSGLVDVGTGQNVILSMNAGVVEGRTAIGHALVFTLSVDSVSGIVTLQQDRPVRHPDGTDPNDPLTLSADNLIRINATVTITDSNGDSATSSANLNIAQAINFDDDGPSILVTATAPADFLVVDESNLGGNATANFADNFTIVSDFGGDGAGSLPPPVYTLSVIAGPSGLIDVATGQNVILSMNAGVVEGRTQTSGALVFTVTVDTSGNVTLDQIRALQHPNSSNPDDTVTLSAANLVKLTSTSTITDRDGDAQTSAATINIGTALIFHDDGPSITVTAIAPADTLSVDETSLGTPATASFADNFNITSSFGADNAGSLPAPSYALSVIAGPSGLIDVATGQNVILSLSGSGVVEGRTQIGGDLVFTVSVDSSGNVTLTQLRSLDHPDTGNPDDTVTLSAADLIKITSTSTITDRDGDEQTSAATINIGTALIFHDDGPSITVTTTAAVDVLTVDETNLGTPATANYADHFTVTSNYGADGAGSLPPPVYTLSVIAGPSGLVDEDSGENVILSLDAGVVEGHTETGGDLVFTVSVDSAGNVTFTQIRTLEHPNTSDPDDSVTLSAANLISLTSTSTITDRDGDTETSSAPINIGQDFIFHDDGPSISITTTAAVDTLSVDETTFGTPATANFADHFIVTSNYGADGAGTLPAPTYTLSTLGGESGLIDEDTGENVILSLNAGVVEGHTETGGELVFTVSVDSSGNVTLTQIRTLDHPDDDDADDTVTLSDNNLISLTATSTITDGDGDAQTSSGTVNIGQALVFHDDGPSVETTESVATIITVDDTNIPTTGGPDGFSQRFVFDFGADGFKDTDHDGNQDADAITYALNIRAPNVNSGLVDTLSGQAILLSLDGAEVVGKTALSGLEVFRITMNAETSQTTLTLSRSIVHDNPNDPVESGTSTARMIDLSGDLITITATITDGDGDTDSITSPIARSFRFEDDGPSVLQNITAPTPTLTVSDSDFGTDASGSFAGLFNTNFGKDGFKDVDNDDVQDPDAIQYFLGIPGDGTDSGLVDTGSTQTILLYLENGVIIGRTATSNIEVFNISVDANTGIVTLDQSRAIVNDNGMEAGLFPDLVTLTAVATDGDLDTSSATKDISDAFKFTDDVPLANDDTGFYAIKGGDDAHSSGNLLTNDTSSADSPLKIVAITYRDVNNVEAMATITNSTPASVLTYLGGLLVVNANGNYTYTPPAPDDTVLPGAPSPVEFSYTAQDADGSESSANVDIQLYDKPIVHVYETTVMEGTDTHASIVVELIGQIPEGITVQYTTQDNSAVDPDDYETTTGTIDFTTVNVNSQQVIIEVPITDDADPESTEVFDVNVTGAAVNLDSTHVQSQPSAEVTIENDDFFTLKATNDSVSVSEAELDPNLPVTTPTQSGNVLDNDIAGTAPHNSISVSKVEFVVENLLSNYPTLYSSYTTQGATITPVGNLYTVSFNLPNANAILPINMPDGSVLKIQSNGHYDYYQPQGGISQDAHYDWTYTITAPLSQVATVGDNKGVLSISVTDQVVYANNDQLYTKGQLSYDIVLMLDVSSSMNTMVSGLSRLAIEKLAAINVVNTYDALAGDLKVTIIPFGSNASIFNSHSGAFSHSVDNAADAISYINSVAIQMRNPANQRLGTGTEYDDALFHARNYLDNAIAPNSSIKDYAHIVYFMTDGAPTAFHAATALTPSWQGFVNDPDNTSFGGVAGSTVKQIDVIPVTIDVSNNNTINNALNPVGNTGQATEIVNLDYNNGQIINLNALYHNLANQSPVTMNLLANDVDTFDNVPNDLSVTQVTYFNPTLNATLIYNLSTGHPQEIFTTAKGATVTVNIDGTFTYQAGPGFNAPEEINESFNYTMSNDANIKAQGQISASVYNNDYTLVNLPGSPVDDILNENGVNNQGTVVMSGAGGNNTFTIDMGMSLHPSLIVIQDFGEGGNNTLKFINVNDTNNDTVIQNSEIISQISTVNSDSPYAGANISFQLQNGTNVILQNFGPMDPIAPPPSSPTALVSLIEDNGNIMGTP